MEISLAAVVIVALAALVTALATGLGAIPLLFVRRASPAVLGASSAVAAGLMLAATQQLAVEGGNLSWARTAAGVVLGGLLVLGLTRVIHSRGEPDVGDLQGANARKALLIVGIMTAHSAAEGIGVGVAYGGGDALGTFITTAIAVHNIPEGLAISLVLVPRGASVLKAAGWSIFSSLPQPLLAVPAFIFVEVFRAWLPVGLGIAAGAMAWMVFVELLPDARESTRLRTVILGVAGGYAAMMAFQIAISP